MVEEKIEVVVLTIDFEVNLAADEGKSDPEFEEKFLNVVEQTPFRGRARARRCAA